MFHDVVQGLLGDPVERLFDLVRKPVRDRRVDADGEPHARVERRRVAAERVDQALLLERARPKLEHERSHLRERVALQLAQDRDLAPGRIEIAFQRDLDGSGHERHGEERLADGIVQLAGEVRPFLARRELSGVTSQVLLELDLRPQVARHAVDADQLAVDLDRRPVGFDRHRPAVPGPQVHPRPARCRDAALHLEPRDHELVGRALMDDLGEGMADQLVRLPARERLDRWAEVRPPSLRVERPDDVRRVVDHEAVALLRVAELLLEAQLLGHVADEAVGAGERAVPEGGRRRDLEGDHPAVVVAQVEPQADHLVGMGGEVFPRREARRDRGRVHHDAPVPADDLLERPAEQPARGRAPEHEPAVRVGLPDAIGRGLDEVPVALLRVAKLRLLDRETFDELEIRDGRRRVVGQRPDECHRGLVERVAPCSEDAERAVGVVLGHDRRDDHRLEADMSDEIVGARDVLERGVLEVAAHDVGLAIDERPAEHSLAGPAPDRLAAASGPRRPPRRRRSCDGGRPRPGRRDRSSRRPRRAAGRPRRRRDAAGGLAARAAAWAWPQEYTPRSEPERGWLQASGERRYSIETIR